MIIDLEIVILVCLIMILMYNYYTNDCYRYFKHNKYSKYQKHQNMLLDVSNRQKNCRNYRNNRNYGNYYYDDTFKNNSNVNYPDIELEGFVEPNVNNNTQNLPDDVLLNDRYNDYITSYSDDQLTNIISEKPSDLSDSDYSQSLVDDLQKNIIFDMDKKLSDKSKKTQKLAKDSATIASRFGRNSLIESYKNELDEYEKERTPWWAESAYN